MMVRRIHLCRAYSLTGPGYRKLVADPGQVLVAAWIAPENEVRRGLVVGIYLRVVLLQDLAAELPPPVLHGMRHFLLYPTADLVIERLSRGPDEDETLHECIIDGTLQAVNLVEASRRRFRGQLPLAILLPERGGPRAV